VPAPPRAAAVLGSPIAHSLSPALHTAAYAALGLHGWTYTAIECDEAGLPALIASCDSAGPGGRPLQASPGSRWAGLSLTMPLKRAVLPLLDRTEPLAIEVGGANTVVCAGATACAAVAALRAIGLTAVVVQVRDQARAGDLLAAARRLGLAVELRPFGSQVRDGDLLVSTVPAGAADFYAERAGDPRARPSAVLDVVYHPWPTPLAAAAARSGVIVVSGFDLLVHQAARQVELMTGLEPAPLAAMRAAGHSELARRAALPTR
jgi:shikimate dehydrogenase